MAYGYMYHKLISIHSPRMGRDDAVQAVYKRMGLISIHSPRMGRDYRLQEPPRLSVDFNPLSPHGERRRIVFIGTPWHKISIHSPRMGRDTTTATWEMIR